MEEGEFAKEKGREDHFCGVDRSRGPSSSKDSHCSVGGWHGYTQSKPWCEVVKG